MASPISRDILARLTDIAMPHLKQEPPPVGTRPIGAHRMPEHRCAALVIGSGAAGLRAAVELKRRGVDVAVLSQSAWGGTSACSGSDKQTLHAANTADRGDNYAAMAAAIRAGGAMDEDTAYVEAVGSSRAMASLQYLGLPLPQDRFGGTLRYQTDHDSVGRATSCGPRTSRLMVKVLAEEAIRLDVPLFNQMSAVRLIRQDGRVCGVLAMRPKEAHADNPLGLAVFHAPHVVLAAGGPGELYRDSVYPNHCFGALGLALEGGLDLVNLTESQFGIGTRREGFPWNLSGTYVQAMPHIYSRGSDGAEHHFLSHYYRTTQELASNIFRKGYQWPFHATRMLDFGSSLLDLAVWRENKAGRRVFMDFNRNPLAVPDDRPFSLERMDGDVRAYLDKADAGLPTPLARLLQMNPLAIELYRRHKIDIAAEPLEFSVNNQHMNGGIAVDIWGRTSVPGCYAVGEAAGTHGVTRPGGAALNAGQVFGTRVAECIAAQHVQACEADGSVLAQGLASIAHILRPQAALRVDAIRSEVQSRMSDHAGMLCNADDVRAARAAGRALNTRIVQEGIGYARQAEALRALQWHQMALVSEAVLGALDHYITMGGGSRGARAICAPDGDGVPSARDVDLGAYRVRFERAEDRDTQLTVRMQDGAFTLETRLVRRMDATLRPFFERHWPDWLTGEIYS